jgi:von Willebrand factor type A domain
MADWIRRSFDGIGVTQSPPGPSLSVLQERYGGTVLLCIDVSGSMHGRRLQLAVAGAETFVADAVRAGYRVGLILWHHGIAGYVPASAGAGDVRSGLQRAFASGGNDIVPTLQIGLRDLGPLKGDRVMAIFGDGDLGPPAPAIAAAREVAALGIRIIVRGLGEHAASGLNAIATEGTESSLVTGESGVSAGISSMIGSVTALSRRPRP